jgi:hypothetical protein
VGMQSRPSLRQHHQIRETSPNATLTVWKSSSFIHTTTRLPIPQRRISTSAFSRRGGSRRFAEQSTFNNVRFNQEHWTLAIKSRASVSDKEKCGFE